MAKKKKMPKGLAEYQKLRKQAKAKGIVVPRGTSREELKALVSGKSTPEKTRKTSKARRQIKANKGRLKKVPRGAKSAKIHWGF